MLWYLCLFDWPHCSRLQPPQWFLQPPNSIRGCLMLRYLCLFDWPHHSRLGPSSNVEQSLLVASQSRYCFEKGYCIQCSSNISHAWSINNQPPQWYLQSPNSIRGCLMLRYLCRFDWPHPSRLLSDFCNHLIQSEVAWCYGTFVFLTNPIVPDSVLLQPPTNSIRGCLVLWYLCLFDWPHQSRLQPSRWYLQPSNSKRGRLVLQSLCLFD